MGKRKLWQAEVSEDPDPGPGGSSPRGGSVYDQSPRMTKRRFSIGQRPSPFNNIVWSPNGTNMSELLEFLLTHEEAFKR